MARGLTQTPVSGLTEHQDFLKHNGFGITLGHFEVSRAYGACLCGHVLRGLDTIHLVEAWRGPPRRIPGKLATAKKSILMRGICDCCASDELVRQRKLLVDPTIKDSGPWSQGAWESRAACKVKRSAACASCAVPLPPGVGYWRRCVEPTKRGGGYMNARINACSSCVLAFQGRIVSWLESEVSRRHPAACASCDTRNSKLGRGNWESCAPYEEPHGFRIKLSSDELHAHGFCIGDPHAGQPCQNPAFEVAFEGTDDDVRASIVSDDRLSGYGRRRVYHLLRKHHSEVLDWVNMARVKKAVGA